MWVPKNQDRESVSHSLREKLVYYEGLCLKKLSAEANKGLIQCDNICQHQNLTVVRKKDIYIYI